MPPPLPPRAASLMNAPPLSSSSGYSGEPWRALLRWTDGRSAAAQCTARARTGRAMGHSRSRRAPWGTTGTGTAQTAPPTRRPARCDRDENAGRMGRGARGEVRRRRRGGRRREARALYSGDRKCSDSSSDSICSMAGGQREAEIAHSLSVDEGATQASADGERPLRRRPLRQRCGRRPSRRAAAGAHGRGRGRGGVGLGVRARR